MKKERKSRILNRAREKSRAEIGPSPSSAPLQGEGKIREEKISEEKIGEGKIGERTEGRPERVPIEPTNMRRHKINRLPPDLKEGLDRMLGEGRMHTCRQLAKWLADNGFRISHEAINKYGRKFERRLEAIRMATEQARLVCEQFKDDDEQMQSALMRLVQTNLFEVLTAVNEVKNSSEGANGPTIAPVNITALARSVSGLARAETEHRKWAARARANVAEAGKKVEEAREKGLSVEAATQIKSILMGIE
jgi:uncharacterized protein DUF3486